MFEMVDHKYDRLFVLKSDITSLNLKALEQAINSFIKEDERDVVIDLHDVHRIDSMAIALFIRVKKRLMDAGRGFELINISEPVRNVIALAGLETFLAQ